MCSAKKRMTGMMPTSRQCDTGRGERGRFSTQSPVSARIHPPRHTLPHLRLQVTHDRRVVVHALGLEDLDIPVPQWVWTVRQNLQHECGARGRLEASSASSAFKTPDQKLKKKKGHMLSTCRPHCLHPHPQARGVYLNEPIRIQHPPGNMPRVSRRRPEPGSRHFP